MAIALRADPSQSVRLGLGATEAAVKETRLSDYRVVAFATHGLVPGDLSGLREPALALSAPDISDTDGDGLLTMTEIMGLRLDADWVILSACNTGTGRGAGAEAVSGLGRAFFYAGTRALLVSSWPVETVSARLLTTDLFARQRENPDIGRAEALRQAVSALIDRPGPADPATGETLFYYAHPIFWAPFVLVGDGGSEAPNAEDL
jgi:CHAT domain-containing protein